MRVLKFRGRGNHGCWYCGLLSVFSPDSGLALINNCYEVDPTTIGQFTGLQDGSGMDIYEGDIVDIPEIDDDDFPAVVTWEEDSASFVLYSQYNKTGRNTFDTLRSTDVVVIGNIHDSSEEAE